MLYQDADDKILEQDIYVDLNEAERVGSSDRVHIVAQVDRYRAGYQGDGDWTSTKRFYVTQDDDLQRVRSQAGGGPGRGQHVRRRHAGRLCHLGRRDLSRRQARADHVRPRHGLARRLERSRRRAARATAASPWHRALGDELYLMELDEALGEIRAQTGLEQFELIGMDACLMGHLEVFSALAPHARYAVASQETEPALGWAYTGFLDELVGKSRHGRRRPGPADRRELYPGRPAHRGRPGPGRVAAAGLADGRALWSAGWSGRTSRPVGAADGAGHHPDGRRPGGHARADGQRQRAVLRPAGCRTAGRGPGADLCPVVHQRLWQECAALLHRPGQLCPVAEARRAAAETWPRPPTACWRPWTRPSSPRSTVPRSRARPASRSISPTPSSTNPRHRARIVHAIARRFADVSLWDDFLAFHYTGRPFERPPAPIGRPGTGHDHQRAREPGRSRSRRSPSRTAWPRRASRCC